MKKRLIKKTNRLSVRNHRYRAIDPASWQLIVHIAIGLVVFAILISLVVGIWYGTRIKTLTIQNIVIEGGQTISHSEIQAVVEQSLVGNYFGLVPKRFVWTYPKASIVTQVANINRVKDLTIEPVSGTQLKIIIAEYIPFALWCDQGNKCFFIDNSATAFAIAPVLDGGSMYRLYLTGKTPTIKTKFTDSARLTKIINFAEGLEKDFGMFVSKIELDLVGDVFFSLINGSEIRITTNEPSEKMLANLALILETAEFQDLKLGKFQYIDLRFGNKIFVNDALPKEERTTTTASTSVDVKIEESEVEIKDSNINDI